MKNRKLIILPIALTLLTLNGVKADDATPLDFEISGAVVDPDNDTTYYVQIPSDSSKTRVTLTATGDDLDAGDCTLTCTACDGSIDDPEEDGNPRWVIDYDTDMGEQSDNGNGELITWDVDSSVSPGGYDFTVNSVSQNFKCPSDDTSDGNNTAKNDNGSQTYKINAIPKIPSTINAYIPCNNINGLTSYVPFFKKYVYEGDDRGPGAENGSSRTTQKCNIIPCKLLNSSGYSNYNVIPGRTRVYEESSSTNSSVEITQEAKNDTILHDGYLKDDEGTTVTDNAEIESTDFTAVNEVKITYANFCGNPLTQAYGHVGTLGYRISITLNYSDPEKPEYSLSGSYKAFPSIEIFLNHKSVYSFVATDRGLSALFDLTWPLMTKEIPGDYQNKPL
jgi:hypothetical protein